MLAVFALVALGMVVIVGALFAASLKKQSSTNATAIDEPLHQLSFDSQALYRPIRRLIKEIEDQLDKQNSAPIQATRSMTRQELQATNQRIVEALKSRDLLRKASDQHPEANREAQRLLAEKEAAASPTLALSFAQAYEAKLGEVEQHEQARDIIKRIDAEVSLTQAKLSELKTRISMAGTSSDASASAEELRSTLQSLEVLHQSIDEVEAMIQS